MSRIHLPFVHLWMASEHPTIRKLCYGCFLERIGSLSSEERKTATSWANKAQANILRKIADKLEGN